MAHILRPAPPTPQKPTEARLHARPTLHAPPRRAGEALEEAHAQGMAVIVKEALANGRLTPRNAAAFAPGGRLAALQAAADEVGPGGGVLHRRGSWWAVWCMLWPPLRVRNRAAEMESESNLRALKGAARRPHGRQASRSSELA